MSKLEPGAVWLPTPANVTDRYSFEVTSRDVDALRAAAPSVPPGTSVSVTFLPNETAEDRLATIRAVRAQGLEPMPHMAARSFASHGEFEDYLARMVRESAVQRCFVIAGDLPHAAGPFEDSSALIATGAFERNGIRTIGVAGHPEGHPHMTEEQCWQVLAAKCTDIEARGIAAIIMTQFMFDADQMIRWLDELRARGIDAMVRVGVPGPAGMKTLVRFAARCGVGASASVLSKYGISITQLFGSAGPDRFVQRLSHAIEPRFGKIRLHFFPFGGVERNIDWINTNRRGYGLSVPGETA